MVPLLTTPSSIFDKFKAALSPIDTLFVFPPWVCIPLIVAWILSGNNSTTSPLEIIPLLTVPVTIVPYPCLLNTLSTYNLKFSELTGSLTVFAKLKIFSFKLFIPFPVKLSTLMILDDDKTVPFLIFSISWITISIHSSSTVSIFVITIMPLIIARLSKICKCSNVWGITPSSAATTNNPKWIVEAPATIFRMNFWCPGTSTIVIFSFK